MIDQRLLRTDLAGVKAALARRGNPSVLDDVDEAALLDARLLDITGRRDAIRARVNTISKEVGRLRRQLPDIEASVGDGDTAAILQTESRTLGDEEHTLAGEHDQMAGALRELLLGIPNPPHPDAPDGADDADNQIVTGPLGMSDPVADHLRVPHWETATALGILDNERASDVHEEVRPPSLVSTATLTATGQLPKFADDAYAIERDDLWCIPTAEVPLTSIYADEVLDDTVLPIRVMAHSSSYRREAGSAGRDTRGMLRAHEFDKVEILAFATPEQAPALLVDMVARAERAIAGLGLPYRIIEICTGDMGQTHHRSFDVEVYAPGADAWLEVSSISWFGEYQARRGNIRFKRHDAEGKPVKGTEFVHTLNGSALAVPRVWAAIIENYRNPDGSVTVPDVLRPYMRGIERIDLPAGPKVEPEVGLVR